MLNLLRIDSRGTTLVEAMVAILILSVGIIPSLAMILVAYSFSSSIRNNLIAANLAQEGVEVIRAIRDNNWFNSRAFDDGLTAPTFDCGSGCRVEWNSTSLINLGTNPPLKFDSSSGLYGYNSGIDTNFRRRIFIVKDPTAPGPPGCNCEIRVISKITWAERGTTKTVNVESHLFNWK